MDGVGRVIDSTLDRVGVHHLRDETDWPFNAVARENNVKSSGKQS
jgi:hypothetical protein